jgi:hypothetical protein
MKNQDWKKGKLLWLSEGKADVAEQDMQEVTLVSSLYNNDINVCKRSEIIQKSVRIHNCCQNMGGINWLDAQLHIYKVLRHLLNKYY